MMNQEQKLSKKKNYIFYVILYLIPLVAILFVYNGYTLYRTKKIYSYIKSNYRGWSGNVHKPDTELGFAPIHNAKGAHVFPIGPDIPMRYDDNGFRIPFGENSVISNTHPVVLALGCSFTYGDAIHAEDAYPYLVGKHFGGTTKNAGCCSYGLSQMLILAHRLIPKHKPDYLIVQYSPWLVRRAISPFAPTYFGKCPTPYFYENGKLELHPPVFQAKMIEPSINSYRNSPKSTIDFIIFFCTVGLPQFIHDDFHTLLYTVKKYFGFIPNPTAKDWKVVSYVYEELAKLARGNGAQLIIVVLGKDNKPVQVPKKLFPVDAILVDAHKALLENLRMLNRENYIRHYAHWRGSPARPVDYHPNEKAHKIIAEAIISKIKPFMEKRSEP